MVILKEDALVYSRHSIKSGCAHLYRPFNTWDEQIMETINIKDHNGYCKYMAPTMGLPLQTCPDFSLLVPIFYLQSS